MTRWWIFNLVGLAGVAVQLVVLHACVTLWHLPYLVATAVAVEAAVLHNFVWHERWTWCERAASTTRVTRLASFHAANGAISLLGNLVIMRVLVGVCETPPIAANLVAIVVCSIVNFVASDRLVYRRQV